MGCSSSKHQSNLADKNAPLSRSTSFPSYGDDDRAPSSKISWASTKHDYSSKMGFSMCQEVGAGHEGSLKHTPMKDKDMCHYVCEEQPGLRRSAAMNAFDYGGHEKVKKHVVSESAPPSPLRKVTREAGLPLWEKKLRSVKVRPTDSVSVDNGSSSFRLAESLDTNSGLRLLLSPVSAPSRSIAASKRFGNFTKTLSSSGRFSHNLNDDMDFSTALNSLSVHERTLSPSEMEGMGDSEEPGSPLFDPSILATFERAIEATSDDTWPCSEVSTSSSSRVVCSVSDICSDADSSNWFEESVLPEACGSMYSENGDAQRQFNFATTGFQKNYLEEFECKFPPGSEDKIVLYFTSLRGVRKTYENCCLVRLILKGFGVHVDERDIWMHSKFKEELTNVMRAAISVPRLFIKGRYIGGAEDVKRLHEEGVLQNLLEGLPAECNSMCGVCGGIRFVPCTTCSGSCKTILIDEVLRCPDCNENGLILCPSCGL